MLNVLQTKIAFDDWVKENVLNKTATKIAYDVNKETCLILEVTDNLDLKDTDNSDEKHEVRYEKHN